MYAREKKENGRRLRLMKRRLKANGVVTTKKSKKTAAASLPRNLKTDRAESRRYPVRPQHNNEGSRNQSHSIC